MVLFLSIGHVYYSNDFIFAVYERKLSHEKYYAEGAKSY
jgi:hypothetical protein